MTKLPNIFPCGCSRMKVQSGLCTIYDTDGVARSRKDQNQGKIYAGDTRLLQRHCAQKPGPFPANRIIREGTTGERSMTMAEAFDALRGRIKNFKDLVVGSFMRALRRITWVMETGEYPVLCADPCCVTVLFGASKWCVRHEMTGAADLAKPVRRGAIDGVTPEYPGGTRIPIVEPKSAAEYPELAVLVEKTIGEGGNIMDALRQRPDLTGLTSFGASIPIKADPTMPVNVVEVRDMKDTVLLDFSDPDGVSAIDPVTQQRIAKDLDDLISAELLGGKARLRGR